MVYEWDSEARNLHWKKSDWRIRSKLEVGVKNVNPPDLSISIKYSSYIKLGLITQFVKALPPDNDISSIYVRFFPIFI